MTPTQIALLMDPATNLSAEARVLVLHVATRGRGPQEIAHAVLLALLRIRDPKKLRRVIEEAEALGWLSVDRRGNNGRHPRFESRVPENTTLQPSSLPEKGGLLTEEAEQRVPKKGTLQEATGGTIGGEVVRGSSIVPKTDMHVVADAPQKKASRSLPKDWTPNDAHRKLAAERGVSVEVEADKMRDWATANAARKADWDATFRNWLRNAKAERSPARATGNGLLLKPHEVTPEPGRGPQKTRMQLEHEQRLLRRAVNE